MADLRARLRARVWSWPVALQVAGALLVAFGLGALLGLAVFLIVLGVEALAAGTLAEWSRAAAKAVDKPRRIREAA